ncbi:DUF309 domain-containing protein [Bacillaceae bacterium Marseille-Q3522]|nr:DUF309 domain-containing protein [Bacillaceae bacterium Marseille-Q3522]
MYPKEYITFLVHFHGDRDYFECHEILVEYWKNIDKGNKKSVWVGLILLAVSCYHYRRNNYNGAERTLQKAISLLKNCEEELGKLAVDVRKLRSIMKKQLTQIQDRKHYSNIHLPLTNPALIALCIKQCKEKNFKWCQNTDIFPAEIVHRHKKRDRTKVLASRKEALRERGRMDRYFANIANG